MRIAQYSLIGCLLLACSWAQAQVVVVVNRDTAVEKINSDQATQMFLKQVQTWPDGKPVQPIDIREGAPLRAEFYSKVTGRSPGQVRAYWARQSFTGMGFPPKQADSAEEVSKLVQATPGAIGYINKKQVAPPLKVVLETTP